MVNYTYHKTSWTRIIEHKWFEFGKDENENDLPKTVISREWKPGDEPYYPVNDKKIHTLCVMWNIKTLQNGKRTLFSADVWANTNFTP